MDLIVPQWPAPDNVRACFTTRGGGVSQGVYQGLNLGAHVADSLDHVRQNRTALREHLGLDSEPLWLNQVHGVDLFTLHEGEAPIEPPIADAAMTRSTGRALTVMTADCLPVFFCDKSGTVIATAHAGWRSLCHGVLEKSVAAMAVNPEDILVWMGPAIGPAAFEVGDEVRLAFMQQDPAAELAFKPAGTSGKWLADLWLLATQRLNAIGVTAIYGGGLCTYSDAERFYSYRRSGQTGRMSGLLWLMPKN